MDNDNLFVFLSNCTIKEFKEKIDADVEILKIVHPLGNEPLLNYLLYEYLGLDDSVEDSSIRALKRHELLCKICYLIANPNYDINKGCICNFTPLIICGQHYDKLITFFKEILEKRKDDIIIELCTDGGDDVAVVAEKGKHYNALYELSNFLNLKLHALEGVKCELAKKRNAIILQHYNKK